MANLLSSPITYFASAARTASITTAATQYRRAKRDRGLLIQIDCTASAATPSVVFTLQHITSDAWATVLASAAITGAGTTNLIVHPDAADIANVSETTQIKDRWRIIATHADADSITYSVKVWPLK